MPLTEWQKKVVNSRARFKVCNCGRGAGKTALAIEQLLWNAINSPKGRVAYIAPTIQQARDIAWKRLLERTSDIVVTKNETRLEINVPNIHGGTSEIVLRGWEAIDTLRGQEFDYLVIDEVSSMRDFFEGWQAVLRPTLRISQGGVLFISTPKGFDHWYELYNTNLPDWQSFTFTSYDNPHVSREEIDSANKSLPEDVFSQEYMADFRKRSGLVYKEFDRKFNTYETASIDVARIYGGVDFGYTNPAAVITVKEDRNGRYWVTDEFYKSGKTHEEIAEYVSSKMYHRVYPDPASPEAIELLNRKRVPCAEVVKGKDSIVAGIQKIRQLLKEGNLMIHRSCTNLIREFETYHYDEESPEKEVPVKEEDHALDALRYVFLMQSSLNTLTNEQNRRFQHNRSNRLSTL